MARRDISGLYFNTDIGPVPTPPGPELTSSNILRRSSRTRSRVTGGMRAITFSSSIGSVVHFVRRQDLAGDHAGLIGRQIERRVGDVLRLDQAQQVRLRELVDRRVTGHQL